MAYRFTNTEKWDDTWFCELKPLSKLLFLYLCDRCDIAGFLEINIRKTAFDLGIGKQEAEGGLQGLGDRIIISPDGKFLFLKNFIKHQKNFPLNEKNKAHIGILSRLNENLQLFNFQSIEDYFKGGLKPLKRGQGIGNDIGNGIGNNEGGMGETNFSSTVLKKVEDLKIELENSYWLESVAILRCSPIEIKTYFQTFCKDLIDKSDDLKTEKDFKSHFVNWLKIELKKPKEKKSKLEQNFEVGEKANEIAKKILGL